MNICFFNTHHIGDTYFIKPFIKNICNLNPDSTFYMYILYGNSLYSDISNIKMLNNTDDKYTKEFTSGENPIHYLNIDNNLKNMFPENYNKPLFTFNYDNKDFVAVNMWCIALGCNGDLQPLEYTENFYKRIEEINSLYKLNIKNTKVDRKNTMPSLPEVPNEYLEKFNTWYKQYKNNKIVFIYNYTPRSIGDFNKINFNSIIQKIISFFSKITFILAKYDNKINYKNVFFCDRDFGSIEVPDCKNLLINELIARHANIIFSPPTGAAWLFFNDTVSKQTSKKYILNFFNCAGLLNRWYKYTYNEDKEVVTFIMHNKIPEIILNLMKMI